MFSFLQIFYLSGTGNAMHAAKWLAEDFEKAGVKSEVRSIDRFSDQQLELKPEGDLIGFFYPTHGFSLAPYMLKFILRFPRARKKQSVVLLNTRAGMKLHKIFLPGLSGLAQLLPAFILLFKGYQIRYMQPLDLPSNWISLHPGIRQKVLDSIHERCRKITNRMAERLLAGKRRYQAFWSLPIDLLISPVAVLYYFIGRFGLAKTFYATSDCDQCSLCIDSCPIQAISFKNNKPFWSYRCESCMRCMNICPKRAIQTSHVYTILLWWAIMAIAIPFAYKGVHTLTNILEEKHFISSVLNLLIQGGTFLLVSIPAYFVAHYSLKRKLIDKLFRYTSLTYYSFWRRYKMPGLKVSQYKKDRIKPNL
jgi:ferredoxin